MHPEFKNLSENLLCIIIEQLLIEVLDLCYEL